ncbi:MAG: metallophosphoesterase [Pseudomonadota bacterium]|nr:metallophosphoesterase [Pseudomonadota bacterium]
MTKTQRFLRLVAGIATVVALGALAGESLLAPALAAPRPAPLPEGPARGEPPLGGGTLRAPLLGDDGLFRAVLIGDGGSRPADPSARALVSAVAAACAAGPTCDAAVLLGDNFYGLGALGLAAPEGPMMRRRFHQRYAPLALPFYAVLGNHEYLSPAPLASVRHTFRHREVAIAGDILVVTPKGPTWVQPWRYWALRDGDDLELIFLDTLALVGAVPGPLEALHDRQLVWLRDHCAATTAPRRRIAFGHHPAATFGKYRDSPDDLLSTEVVEALLACGVRDYASGHDHHLQRIDLRTTRPDGTIDAFHQVVSGKGGAVRKAYPFADVEARAHPPTKPWDGLSWVATLASDHTGDRVGNQYAGWTDLRVTRGPDGAVDVTTTLEGVDPPAR